MSAATVVSPDPALSESPSLLSEGEPLRKRWTVAEYHRMAESGLLKPDERVELIAGEILTMSPVNSPHRTAVFHTTKAHRRRA